MSMSNDLRLQPDEEIMYNLRTHPKLLFTRILFGVILLVLAVLVFMNVSADIWNGWLVNSMYIILGLVGTWYVIFPVIVWLNNRFIITNKQIIVLSGVFIKEKHSSQISRVSDLNVECGILDRLFKCGTLIVYNASGDVSDNSSRVTLKDIPNVLDVEQGIKNIILDNKAEESQRKETGI